MQYVVQALEFVHERQESSTKASASTPRAQEAFRLLLDVFEHEPVDPSSPLLQHQNFHGTPHIGAATIEAQRRVGLDIVDAVLTVLDGGMAETTVNRSDLS